MKEYKLKVKAKILGGKFSKTQEFDYSEPENLEEAVDVDGDRAIMNTYLTKRKTNFMDSKRRNMETELTKKLAGLLEREDIAELLD